MLNLITSLVLQASLFSTAFASDVSASGHGNAYKYGTGGGIFGLIALVVDVIIFFEVFQSSRPPAQKALWTLGVFFFPLIGAILYFLFSEREKYRPGSGYESIA